MNYTAINEKLKEDTISFLYMCPLEDKKLLLKEPKDKTIEDFARFVCLGMAFEMHGAYLKTFAEGEQVDKFNSILEYLNSLKFETIEKWVDDFIDKIEERKVQKLAQLSWEKKKKKIKNKMKNGKFKFKCMV